MEAAPMGPIITPLSQQTDCAGGTSVPNRQKESPALAEISRPTSSVQVLSRLTASMSFLLAYFGSTHFSGLE